MNTTNDGVQYGGGVVRLAGGSYVAVWQSSAVRDNFVSIHDAKVMFQRYDANGNPVGPEIAAALDAHSPKVAALANGEFLITWSQSRYQYEANAFARRYGADGIPVGPQITLARTYYQYQAEPVALSGGGFMIAINGYVPKYGPSYGAYQLYNPDGSPTGVPVVLNRNIDDPYSWVRVQGATHLSDGGFALVWEEGSSGAGPRMMTQAFDSNGDPRGDPLQILAENSFAGEIITLADGNYVVVWESSTAVGRQATAQIFTPDGALLHTRVLVSGVQSPTGSRLGPKVAALMNGGFVVAYTAVDRDTPTELAYRVLAQRYNAQGQAINSVEQIAFQTISKPFVGGNTLEATGATFDNFIVYAGTYTPATFWDLRAYVR